MSAERPAVVRIVRLLCVAVVLVSCRHYAGDDNPTVAQAPESLQPPAPAAGASLGPVSDWVWPRDSLVTCGFLPKSDEFTAILPVIDFGFPNWADEPDGRVEIVFESVAYVARNIDVIDVSLYVADESSLGSLPLLGRSKLDVAAKNELIALFRPETLPATATLALSNRYAILVQARRPAELDADVDTGTFELRSFTYSANGETFEVPLPGGSVLEYTEASKGTGCEDPGFGA